MIVSISDMDREKLFELFEIFARDFNAGIFDRFVGINSENSFHFTNIQRNTDPEILSKVLKISRRVDKEKSKEFLRFLKKKFGGRKLDYSSLSNEEKALLVEEFKVISDRRLIAKILRCGHVKKPECLLLIGESVDTLIIREMNPERFDIDLYSLIQIILSNIGISQESFCGNCQQDRQNALKVCSNLFYSLTATCLNW